jgi:hypothetical protein
MNLNRWSFQPVPATVRNWNLKTHCRMVASQHDPLHVAV